MAPGYLTPNVVAACSNARFVVLVVREEATGDTAPPEPSLEALIAELQRLESLHDHAAALPAPVPPAVARRRARARAALPFGPFPVLRAQRPHRTQER